MKLAVITHIIHKEKTGELFSYEPYIREMNLWFKYASKVTIVAPITEISISKIDSKYLKKEIDLREIPSISFLSFYSVISSLLKLPLIFYKVFEAMKEADHIHLRCPGNIGLVGCVLQILFPKKPKTVKYAGNWDPKAKQPWSYNLQKRILGNATLSKNIKVLVYGDWEAQSKNIVPFFTASFSESENYVEEKQFASLFKFIFVGSLNDGKRPLFTIKLVEHLLSEKIPVNLEMYGNGTMGEDLKEYVNVNNLDPFIKMMGNQNLDTVKDAYKRSQFLILASKSEGWPKAIAEAMFFGCIPISTSISCVPWMLNYGKRGVLIPADVEKASRIIQKEMKNLEELKLKSIKAQEWSQQYTLEKFEHEIQKLLNLMEKSSKNSFNPLEKGTDAG